VFSESACSRFNGQTRLAALPCRAVLDEQQHQQQSGLLWAKVACHDCPGVESRFSPSGESIDRHRAPIRHARRNDDRYALVQRVLHGLEHGDGYIAHAYSLDHDAFRALVHRIAQQIAIGAAEHRQDFHARHLALADIDVLAPQRRARELHAV